MLKGYPKNIRNPKKPDKSRFRLLSRLHGPLLKPSSSTRSRYHEFTGVGSIMPISPRTSHLLLEQMNIPRCFKPDEFGNLKTTELHNVSDASVDGYGQCSYLRIVDYNDRIHCSLVIGKSRVNPLKPITIPRLGLMAALVSVKVSEMLQRELRYHELKEFFWTDSQVVTTQAASRHALRIAFNKAETIPLRTNRITWKANIIQPMTHHEDLVCRISFKVQHG